MNTLDMLKAYAAENGLKLVVDEDAANTKITAENIDRAFARSSAGDDKALRQLENEPGFFEFLVKKQAIKALQGGDPGVRFDSEV
ncbi:MAG: hypothetical protein HZA78_04770 [Candidatus Schekmanbacteria bacterium]|nr:hypothetical protein [Candidatus Schekmanbacteria bacterium]